MSILELETRTLKNVKLLYSFGAGFLICRHTGGVPKRHCRHSTDSKMYGLDLFQIRGSLAWVPGQTQALSGKRERTLSLGNIYLTIESTPP